MRKKRIHNLLSSIITICLVVTYVLLLMCVWIGGNGNDATICGITLVIFLTLAVLLVIAKLLVEVFVRER